jgi:hypothetical protein
MNIDKKVAEIEAILPPKLDIFQVSYILYRICTAYDLSPKQNTAVIEALIITLPHTKETKYDA